MAKQAYVCEHCREFFASMEAAEMHEKICVKNPANKVNDKVLFRLSMIYEELDDIVACAISEVAGEMIGYLEEELGRANDVNCCYAIHRHKGSMMRALRIAPYVRRKHNGRDSNTYRDVEKENPELLQAVIATLERKAWNER